MRSRRQQIIWGGLGFALLCGVSILVALAYCVYDLPISSDLNPTPARPSIVLESRSGEVFARRGIWNSEAVEFRKIPPDLVNAVVAIEDRRFFNHIGIDFRSIGRALLTNLREGEVREGASTITQQLARTLFLFRKKTFKRKIQEVMIALWLERQLSKEEILARYLGAVYFGSGAYGAEAAARLYFDKALATLSLSEAALLAGLIRAPSTLAPTHNLEAARRRGETVLQVMVDAGLLGADRAAKARAEPARLADIPGRGGGAAYFADWIATESRRLLGPVTGSFVVRTTLDLELQALAETVIARALERTASENKIGQAALIAMTLDGAVLAMVGGRDYDRSQFNRATQARRQPGSLYKLFVYLAALDAGYESETVMSDRPMNVNGWHPKNYDGRYRGDVTLREAFAQSINTVAIGLAQEVGPKKVIEMAAALGIETRQDQGPSFALGTSEVTLLDIVAAYAAVASEAKPKEPHGIRTLRGRDRDRELRHEMSEGDPEVLSRDTRIQMLDLLSTAVRSGTGKAAYFGEAAAGKTGTTQDHRDAWFVGFTEDLVVGVWLGNDDNTPMVDVTGGGLPAKIWRDFMVSARAVMSGDDRDQDRPGISPESSDRVPTVGALPGPATGPTTPLILQGHPSVLDTTTLRFGETIVRLAGVRSEGTRFARELQEYIGDREVICRPYSPPAYRCEAGGYDLSEVVLFNGGGRALPEAPPDLKAAEFHARNRLLGIWR